MDREKDIVIAGGYDIYPVEIDNVLMEHPKIRHACAVGVPHEYRGKTLKAFVLLNEGETMTEEVITFSSQETAKNER